MHKHFGARKIELLMVDYRLSMLQRVTDPFSGRDERTALVPVDRPVAPPRTSPPARPRSVLPTTRASPCACRSRSAATGSGCSRCG